MKYFHEPVLMSEVLAALKPQTNEIYVDACLGGGGHSEAILKASEPNGMLIAIDQDQEAIKAAGARLEPYRDRLKIIKGNFANIESLIKQVTDKKVAGVLFDIGVSSHQLDDEDRGFSYHKNAPLDMRMDQNSQLSTAADLVNNASAAELSQIIFDYGEERWAKRIAEFIVVERKKEKILYTEQLVSVIKMAIPKGARAKGSHPAKKTFQALRIATNDELRVLTKGLNGALNILKPGGIISVITFHSLEDRIVKNFFREKAKGCICPPKSPICICDKKPEVKIINRKPIIASEEELARNRRARSAKLRSAKKL